MSLRLTLINEPFFINYHGNTHSINVDNNYFYIFTSPEASYTGVIPSSILRETVSHSYCMVSLRDHA